jgi:hypothetical protein
MFGLVLADGTVKSYSDYFKDQKAQGVMESDLLSKDDYYAANKAAKDRAKSNTKFMEYKEENYNPSSTRDLIYSDDFYWNADAWTIGSGAWGYNGSSYPYYISSSYNYDYDTHSMQSPSIDLSAVGADHTAELSWNQSGAWCGDYGYSGVSVSSDGGASFTTLAEVGCSAAWEAKTLDLSAYIGSSIIISFDVSGYNAHRWDIDDVAVNSAAPLTECTDASACNTGEVADCTYPATNYDCDENCIAALDCAGTCGGLLVEDECGNCGGDGTSCYLN